MKPKPLARAFRAALVAAAASAAPAHAADVSAGALTIGRPHAIETAPAARAGVGYFTVTNGGAEPDRLLEVRADFPGVALHTTEVDADGVARMVEVEAVEIPPGATVAFEPRGLHVMFMGLEAPLETGATVAATLVFERAGEVEVAFEVEPRGAAHSGHEGMGH